MGTEKEKMIAGELYFAWDPELVADRTQAKKDCQALNAEENPDKAEQLAKAFLGQTGKRVHLEAPFTADYGYNIKVGENFYTNYGNIFLDSCPITIGDNCMFGPNVQLYTATHPLQPQKRNSGLEFAQPITIGNNVWLGGAVVITPGVTLGDNVVVGSGAVVTKSFPSNVVLGGNPAQIIKTIETEATDALHTARQKIDQIDAQLVTLLEQRMGAVADVVAAKQQTNQQVLDVKREAIVLDKVSAQIQNQEYEAAIVATFEDIMKHSRAFQNGRLGDL